MQLAVSRLTDGDTFQNYAALEFLLLGDLRDLLDEPAVEETRKWLRVVLEALVDTLPQEFAREEDDGYMTEVIERYPGWYRAVDHLREEHQSLYCMLRELQDRVNADHAYAEMAEFLCQDLRDWMTRITRHHSHERRLLQTAMNLETGSGE